MVHALKEIWRVLVPDGIMVDLRPLSGQLPLEIVADGQAKVAGLVDDSEEIPNDIAASKSLARVAQQGWFIREREEAFDYSLYWDTIDEMKAYMEENWDPTPVMPETVAADARRLLASSGDGARARLRMNVLISRYRKDFPPVRVEE